MKVSVLIIGADSLVGTALMNECRRRGIPAAGTSRREHNDHIFLDLLRKTDYSTLPKAHTVFLCAGINGFAACNENLAAAAVVNVSTTIEIGTHYITQGSHVIFLSSTAVFGGRSRAPGEKDAVSPHSTYGAFKCATEIALLEAADFLGGECSIVRLTKTISTATPLLNKWITLGARGQIIETFSDSFLSPISLSYVVSGLLEVANQRASGIFHFSGAQTLTYFNFAKALGERGIIPAHLIRRISQSPLTKSNRSIQCVFLAMPNTAQRLGLIPQSVTDLLAAICYENHREDLF